METIASKTRHAYNLAAQKYHDLFHDEMSRKEYDRRLLDGFAQNFGRGSLVCDAGCGPSAHIGRYMFERGIPVIGVDISDQCIELARRHNPQMEFERGDIANLAFPDQTFDGVIAYYSIIDTPKRHVGRIFRELNRVLRPNGYLLVAAKAGTTEGYLTELLGLKVDIYLSLFTKEEIADYYEESGFRLDFVEQRAPYDFEIGVDRIFAIGQKHGPRQQAPPVNRGGKQG